MEAWQRTIIGHRGMLWCNPLGWPTASSLHGALGLRPGARLLDLCCGKGALLTWLCDWTPEATGVGVDQVPAFLDEARAHAEEEGVADRVRFELADVRTWAHRQRGYDLACCVGARPFGATRATLEHLVSRARGGGAVVIGEGYWRRPPDPAYLELLGCSQGEYRDLAGTLALGGELGLDLEYWSVTTRDQLDEYEGAYLRNLLAHGRRHADQAGARQLAESARRWRDGYLRWGRATLGFVVAAFRLPAGRG